MNDIAYVLWGFALASAVAVLVIERINARHAKELNQAKDKGWVDGYFKCAEALNKPVRDAKGRFATKPTLLNRTCAEKPEPKHLKKD